ncbi:cytochrome P450 3A19 [Rhipicephalus sanguineus]|uniref:cytochrome P450 3A19 n=1 Tax=Rhipicephalus sanguineus TaxID=34632 RepID=UPI0020C3EADA|nr:cytochrome P450 3A19 [Rhipicephalus sanguineus]
MAQCVLFFLAGQETTLTTLTFAAYQLALNPAIQEKLRKEVDECIAANGPEPSLDVISKLKYLNCVVSEALRLLPPRGELPSGCTVIIPVYSIHHDPEFFSDPECFKPDRFSEENVGSIRPYTYLPFGAGPRNCIGSRFVLQSIKMCLLHSVHSVQFTKTDKTKKTSLLEYGDGQIDSTDV